MTNDIGEFLMVNYYSKYKGSRLDVVPTREQLEKAIVNHGDKIVVVRDDKIKGIGIFITISDKTYEELNKINITDFDILCQLVAEHGPHIHFVLICADGVKTILTGIDYVKNTFSPETISWWNPDLTKLHIYKVRK